MPSSPHLCSILPAMSAAETQKSGPLRQILLTPGPTQVPEAVLRELAEPVIHHRTSAFRAIFGELSERLARVFRTAAPVLTLSGSGTTAFEAAMTSLIERGQKAVTCAAGKFGERWQDICQSCGVEQVRIDAAWGEPIEAARVAETLAAHPDARVVVVVHSETSTCTACDLEAIANIVSKTDALLIVDGITSVAALPMQMDDWDIDVVVTGSQKALMLPPGLGFAALGPRARQRMAKTKGIATYTLDLRRWLADHTKNDVPFTPAINLVRAQRVALEMIENEGLENVWARTRRLARATRAALEAMDLKLVSRASSDSVTGAFYPAPAGDEIDDAHFRAALRERHGIHVAGGQKGRLGDFAGRIFRISHMGHVNAQDTRAALDAVETELIACGCRIEPGTALKAANAVLEAAD
jgi:aspartate aminotransferase-like enzyme